MVTLSGRWMLMQHSLYILREHGLRHWIAWKLVCLSRRICDTTYYEAIVHTAGMEVLIESDAWGRGIAYLDAHDDEMGWHSGEFIDWNNAMDWMQYIKRSGQ